MYPRIVKLMGGLALNAESIKLFIGIASKPVKNEVEKGAIRKFADAIGDPNPLFRSEESARHSRYGKIVAPPTFCRTFDYGEIPELNLNKDGVIHGEQAFEYYRPILAGDVLYCSTKLADVREKTGNTGRMIMLVYEQVAVNETEEIVVRGKSTVIYRG